MNIEKIGCELSEVLNKQIQSIREEVIANRRYFHMHPEIGFDTENTEKKVRHILTKEGIQLIQSKVGVLGLIKGSDSSRMIALRADMDALCLQEDNEVPYKSIYPNRMHACGHDGHTAMLLGAAKILQNNRANLPVDVLLIFQPAEEGPNLGGARIIVNDLEKQGYADKIQYIFSLHLFNDFEIGKVGVRYGSLMSSTDEFDIKIIGKGGHAGQPHKTVDALSIGTKFVAAIESFMARRKDPFDPAVCSIGIFNSGSAKNIVAETAMISGTIRCQTEKTREYILENIEKILKGICEGFSANYRLEVLRGIPVLVNDADATTYAEELSLQAVGKENTFRIPEATMGAEDFAYFAQKIPASFLWIGSGNKEKGFTYLAHHPKFDFDEDALLIGIKEFCYLALGLK
ncbi:M20 metallopeptidase family protein [Anaerovorax sp. IOR16]|uniref:M20 metallopeptidase family protein n=1 Tax=Anaerovorax sp. IOR16 TaxID=2773458 RepID=UPI0019D0E59E|nr:amidohydrolase [Anaerovorax sp. IOR16]